MAKQRFIKASKSHVGCNTCDHFVRTYDEATMRAEQFNRVCSIHKRIIRSMKRTIRGYAITLNDGQKANINIRG